MWNYKTELLDFFLDSQNDKPLFSQQYIGYIKQDKPRDLLCFYLVCHNCLTTFIYNVFISVCVRLSALTLASVHQDRLCVYVV